MRRFILPAIAILTSLSLLSGCGKASGNGASGSDRKTFTVGFDAEFPPYRRSATGRDGNLRSSP